MSDVKDPKIEHIIASLEKMEYGSLVITVHNGEITQIDATEKKRFPSQKRSTVTHK